MYYKDKWGNLFLKINLQTVACAFASDFVNVIEYVNERQKSEEDGSWSEAVGEEK